MADKDVRRSYYDLL